MKEYGVNEDILFHVDDLLYSNNTPKVARCLKEVAIIVSINKDNWQKKCGSDRFPDTDTCLQPFMLYYRVEYKTNYTCN